MKPGDYLLCYLTGISRWIGVLEVVSEPFKDTTPIWKDEAFPARVRVRQVAALSPETAVPVFELRDELSVFRDLKNRKAVSGQFCAARPGVGAPRRALSLSGPKNPQRVARPLPSLPSPLEAGRRPGCRGRHP